MRQENATQLGKSLKILRQQLRLSLRYIELLLKERREENPHLNGVGINRIAISRIEEGVASFVNPHLLFALAQIYGVNYNELMRLAGYPVRSEEEAKQDRAYGKYAYHP